MKPIAVGGTLLIIALLLASPAGAQFTGPGAGSQVTSAAGAIKAPDGTPVVLEGNLLKQLTEDTYEFRDATGSVTVEIDSEDFQDRKADASTKVRLYGEVDRDWRSMEIDVKRIEVL